MGIEGLQPKFQDAEWQLVLAYIAAKRTHEPAFRELFDRMLHRGHPKIKVLDMLYDFTVIRLSDEPDSDISSVFDLDIH